MTVLVVISIVTLAGLANAEDEQSCEEVLGLCAAFDKCVDACLDQRVEPGLVKGIKSQVDSVGRAGTVCSVPVPAPLSIDMPCPDMYLPSRLFDQPRWLPCSGCSGRR